MRRSVESRERTIYSDLTFMYFHPRADIIFQKSIKKRAEAVEMMEKEMADTEARQEKVGHKLKERIGKYSRAGSENVHNITIVTMRH